MTLDFGASASGSYQYRKAGTDSEWQDLTVNSSGLAIINTSALELHYGSSLELKPTDGSETVTVKVLDNALRNGGFETTTGGGTFTPTQRFTRGARPHRTDKSRSTLTAPTARPSSRANGAQS